ncbi:DUF1761 domain-containing protein [Maricaulis sp. CAU 1757]
MPRIFGVNLIAWLVASVVAYFVGFIFYGLLFTDLWVGLWGFSEAELQAAEAGAAIGMIGGFVITLATALAIGIALRALDAMTLGPAIKWAVFLWAGFVITTMAYDIAYASQPFMLLVLDGAHTLVAFIAMAAALVLLDGVGAKSAAAPAE